MMSRHVESPDFDRLTESRQIVKEAREDRMAILALRAALENSTSMMEAMMVQMHSWDIEVTVNVRGQMSLNKKLLANQ